MISFIKSSGKELIPVAGTIEDLGSKKKWLTEKDLEIEQRFAELIKSFSGKHILFAEEEHEELVESDNLWILDPISHTVSFIHGLPHFAISVCHVSNGEVVFACVYDPSMDELFIAEKDKGAYLNDSKIQIQDFERDRIILYDLFPVGKWNLEENIELFTNLTNHIGRVKSYGSMAIHYCYVACGRVQAALASNKDCFPEFAGCLIVQEAGGIFTDFYGNKLTHEPKGIVASVPNIHKMLLSMTTGDKTLVKE